MSITALRRGKKYLILGENGSGKSTLFKLLTGLESEYEGRISVNGTDIRGCGPRFMMRLASSFRTRSS